MGRSLLPPVPDVAAYRKVHGDPSVWLDAVAEICRRHDLDAEDLYAECSGTNVVFRIRTGPWIKLFPPLWLQDHARERTALAAARTVPGLTVPHIIETGTLEDWPYLVLSHVEGAAVGTVWADMTTAERVDVARQVGALMARLHEVDPRACAAIAPDWDAWVADALASTVARQRGHGLDEVWAADLTSWIEALPPMGLEAGDEPVFLHADLTDDHIFVRRDEGRWRVTGLIDFGDAMVGDRLYEFATPLVFLCQRRPREQAALLEGYGWRTADLTPARLDRMAAWCLLHRWGRLPAYVGLTPEPKPRTLVELLRALRPCRPASPEANRPPQPKGLQGPCL